MNAVKNNKQALIVLGMHRSGTSALTRCLNLLGAQLPKNLMPSLNANNAMGFWEPVDAYRLNEELLSLAGSRWNDWRNNPAAALSADQYLEFRRRAIELIEINYSGADCLVFKDPRVCRLYDFWQDAFSAAGYAVKSILIYRNPLEIAGSLAARDRMSYSECAAIWLRHVLDSERVTRNSPRTILSFDQLLARPEQTLRRLSAELSMEWPVAFESAGSEISQFLSSEHRHHQELTHLGPESGPFSYWCKSVLEAMSQLSVSGSNAQALSILDDVGRAFDQGSMLFSPIIDALERSNADLTAEQSSLTGLLAARDAKHAQDGDELTHRAAQIENYSQHTANLGLAITKLQNEIESKHLIIEELRAGVEAQKSSRQQDRDAHKAEIDSYDSEKASLLEELDSLTESLGTIQELYNKEQEEQALRVEEANQLQASILGKEAELQRVTQLLNLSNDKLIGSAAYTSRPDLESSRITATLWLLSSSRRLRLGLPFTQQAIAFVHHLARHELFDAVWYSAKYLGVPAKPDAALRHWLFTGWREGNSPCAEFDLVWYTKAYPDVKQSGLNPYYHYVAHGEYEGRRPGPYFEPAWYAEQNSDVAQQKRLGLLSHYRAYGRKEGRAPNPYFDPLYYAARLPRVLVEHALAHYLTVGYVAGLRPSAIFDAQWYLTNNAQLLNANVEPLGHFLLFGDSEGRSPNPYFNSQWYFEHYSDAANSGMAPFRHYYLHAPLDGSVSPGPDFDASAYIASQPSLRTLGINPLKHALENGHLIAGPLNRVLDEAVEAALPLPKTPASSARMATTLAKALLPPHLQNNLRMIAVRRSLSLTADDFKRVVDMFNDAFYLRKYPELAVAVSVPVEHYLRYGWREGRNPCVEFDTQYYLKHSPDVAQAGINPFVHWVLHGKAEKRQAVPFDQRAQQTTYLPLVSCIVPNYNHAPYLRERVGSLINQTYENTEIIILDDCSSDDSRDLIKTFSQEFPEKIRFIFNDKNVGNVFKQWRKGVEEAKGDLIWICESDDFCDLDFLEKLVPSFSDRSVQLAFGRIQFSDKSGKFQSGLDDYREGAESGIWNKKLTRPAAKWFAGAFGVNNVIANVGGCLWRNQQISPIVWSEVEKYSILGDWYLYLMLAGGGQISYEPDAVAYFRQHGQNTSVKSFLGETYYREHGRFLEVMRSYWEIPEATCSAFAKKVSWQYAHHDMDKKYGSLKKYFDPEQVVERAGQPHVLMAFLGFQSGGGEVVPIQLANALATNGVRVSMLALDLTDINQEMLGSLSTSVPVYDAAYVAEYGLDEFVADAGVSVIHTHILAVDWFLLEQCKLGVNIPYVVTLHGSYEATEVKREQLEKFAGRVDHWIYLADKNLEPLKKLQIAKQRFTKLPNAMLPDARPFPRTRTEMGIHEDAVVFTLVARGIQRKGWRAAVNAFQRLRTKYPSVHMHLLLAGEGEAKRQQEELAERDDNITFLGYQSCIQGLYRLSDVAIVPTRFAGESFPLCIVEALMNSIPVIATDIGEIGAMVCPPAPDAPAGILIEQLRNTDSFIANLSAAMEKMLNRDTRQAFSAAAGLVGVNFCMTALVDSYLAIYKAPRVVSDSEILGNDRKH